MSRSCRVSAEESSTHLEQWVVIRYSIHLTKTESWSVSMCSCSVASDSLQCHRLYLTRLLCPWDSSGNNTAVGCYFLLQGIFLDPGIEPESSVSPSLAGRFFIIEPPGTPFSVSIGDPKKPNSKCWVFYTWKH